MRRKWKNVNKVFRASGYYSSLVTLSCYMIHDISVKNSTVLWFKLQSFFDIYVLRVVWNVDPHPLAPNLYPAVIRI